MTQTLRSTLASLPTATVSATSGTGEVPSPSVTALPEKPPIDVFVLVHPVAWTQLHALRTASMLPVVHSPAASRPSPPLVPLDVLTTRVYTVVPSYVRRPLIRRERVICADPECNAATTATMPPMPSERALYDCRFLAWIIVMKFVLLVPLDPPPAAVAGRRQRDGHAGAPVERAADLVDPIDGEHMKQLRASACMCFDGTGLKALVLGQSKA